VSASSVGPLTIAYHGTQRTTNNRDGDEVYGGSDLVCVRGDWRALEQLDLSNELAIAVAQARTFDMAASGEYRIVASRRNYDIAQGVDGAGKWRSGVLEQSWRLGGASGAELAALHAFAVA
jgi:hypothetical protein